MYGVLVSIFSQSLSRLLSYSPLLSLLFCTIFIFPSSYVFYSPLLLQIATLNANSTAASAKLNLNTTVSGNMLGKQGQGQGLGQSASINTHNTSNSSRPMLNSTIPGTASTPYIHLYFPLPFSLPPSSPLSSPHLLLLLLPACRSLLLLHLCDRISIASSDYLIPFLLLVLLCSTILQCCARMSDLV